jgi:hypothetical protein
VLPVTVSLKNVAHTFKHGACTVSIQMGVAMLAEIFIVRLEAAARALRDRVPPRTSRFVSFNPNSQVTFKVGRKRPLEAVPPSNL